MKVELKLYDIVQKWNIDHFGIADFSIAATFSESAVASGQIHFPRAISIGINLFDPIVNQLPERKTRSVCVAYKHHCYDMINVRLDLAVSEISSHLQRSGFEVMPVPASKRIDDKTLSAIFSHKMAANLCGLGWIGKSCLLITPSVGPRVRFATVLTNAPLESTGTPIENKCGDCTECVNICPPQAFTGRPFYPDEKRESRYDAHKCDRYHHKIKQVNEWAVCGMCVYVCPYGRDAKF